jgi:transposase
MGGTISQPKGGVIMKISQCVQKSNQKEVMDISVDVHKDTLNFFFEAGSKEYSDACSNRTTIIMGKLEAYQRIAQAQGMTRLRVICEPTGEYHKKLFRTARNMGFLTCFVNAEAVAKFRVIETNDTGKTDTKDPRVIRTLGRLNKVVADRSIGEDYMVLRKFGMMYDEGDQANTRLRCRINRLLVELFCDYSFKKDFLYSASGMALIDNYGCNPYRIVRVGFARFSTRMRKAAPRIQIGTLQRLWNDAVSSVHTGQPQEYVATLESHLLQLIDDWNWQKKRKEDLVRRMIETLYRLREEDPRIPPATFGVISDKNMARLLGETGPLSDFPHWRTLMRYAGLNIRMRQSGRYQGLNKISKKGRPLLRRVLQNVALPLVKKGCLYGSYYAQKKEEAKMPGNKAMTCVARHFLKKFYGWYKSGEAFNKERFFSCESQIKAVA